MKSSMLTPTQVAILNIKQDFTSLLLASLIELKKEGKEK